MQIGTKNIKFGDNIYNFLILLILYKNLRRKPPKTRI